jgi:hypothetical protein
MKIHDARACHGANGLVLIREVGGDHLRSAGHRMCFASYESEWMLPRREEVDHFIGYNAACSEDGDHVRCPRLLQERPGFLLVPLRIVV